MKSANHNEPEVPVPAPAPEESKQSVSAAREKTRRNLLHLVAGGYLLYLSYQLGSGFLSGISVEGWNGNMVISLVGAVIFLLTGGFLLVSCLLRMFREYREDHQK